MYVHLGGDVVVRAGDVVAIVDLSVTQRRGLTLEDIVGKAGKDAALTRVGDGVGASLVITADNVYVSPISPLTLRRRAMAPWLAEQEDGGLPVVSVRRRRRSPRRARRGP